MGSAVKWVFYALFGTVSTVKLFHSFEYRKIPWHNSLWRCPLYSGTIFKSWIQLFAVSIFALPNKSPLFRLSHCASEKLLNVYVLHFLDKQWLPEFVLLITVLNDRKKRCVSPRIFVGKQKTFTIFLGTIHGSHRESKLGLERLKKWVFAWILQEVKSSRMGFKYFSSGWILMVPKHSLLKYFTLTFTRHKS